MAYVYQHIRLDTNEVFYVGIGKKPKHGRAYTRSDRNPFWEKVVAKTSFKVEILFDNLTWEQACEKEKELIALYGRRDLGTGTLVNLTDGGDTIEGYVHKESTKAKMREKMKGNTNGANHKMTEENKRKLSESLKNRVRTPESIQKMALSKTGSKASEETRNKMRESQRLRRASEVKVKRTEEQRARMSVARRKRPPFSEATITKLKERFKIKPHPMLGKKHSEESKQKMRKAKSKIYE